MTREDLEFSISQYLDNTLPPADRAALESRLPYDAEARELLAEYRQLEVALKAPAAMPEVRWDALAAHLSGVIGQEAAQPAVPVAPETSEAVEFLASQYVDGTLSSDEQAAFDVRVQSDAGATALLSEYRQLDVVVKTSLPLPPVRWEALADHLSGVVADSGAKPVFSFKWARTAGRIAVAAGLLLAAGIGVQAYRGSHPNRVAVTPTPPPAAVAVITGPQLEQAAGRPVVEVTIGGPAVADAGPGGNSQTAISVEAGDSSQFADVVVSRPSRVVIATGKESAQDGAQMPY